MVKFFNILIPGCIIFMLLFLSSCEKEIEMKISDQPPRLVINSIINPDSLFIVNVSSTWPILESKGNSYLNNACVKVYNQDIFLEQLPLFDMAYYISKSLKPQTGIDYKIEVTCDGYNKATAHLTIPPPVKITNINIVKSISSQYDAEMEFTDPGNEKNYYMISILQGKPDSIGEQVVLQDASKIDFNYNSSIVEIFNQGSSYIDVEQMNDLGLGGITNNIETATEVLFSDEKIQGKTFNFKFDFQYGFSDSVFRILNSIYFNTFGYFRFF